MTPLAQLPSIKDLPVLHNFHWEFNREAYDGRERWYLLGYNSIQAIADTPEALRAHVTHEVELAEAGGHRDVFYTTYTIVSTAQLRKLTFYRDGKRATFASLVKKPPYRHETVTLGDFGAMPPITPLPTLESESEAQEERERYRAYCARASVADIAFAFSQSDSDPLEVLEDYL